MVVLGAWIARTAGVSVESGIAVSTRLWNMVLTPITVFTMWLALGPLLQGDDAPGGRPRNKMEGTWEHTISSNPGLRQVKVINQDHFIWVTYDRASKLAVTTAGGSYTHRGR